MNQISNATYLYELLSSKYNTLYNINRALESI